jgi:deoxyribonuclease-4
MATTAPAAVLRVRQILDRLDESTKKQLKKLLPIKTFTPPTGDPINYPSMLLKCLPSDVNYSFLGIIAENLLRLPHEKITMDALIAYAKGLYPLLTPDLEGKIRSSKTTQPFLNALVRTRMGLDGVLRKDSTLKFEEEVRDGPVVAHPDMYNKTQVFEVKLSGMLKQNWSYFLLQAFSYASLLPETTDVYLVLPLQQTIWTANLAKWETRSAFKQVLVDFATKQLTTVSDALVKARAMVATFGIGVHVGKQKTISHTLLSMGDYTRPYQIFLSGPQNSKMKINADDLTVARQIIEGTGARIYIHSQYIINLCAVTEDDWNVKLLIQNLDVAKKIKSEGVVVHVGKYVKQSPAEAIEIMRKNILRVLEHATPECPLLLETAAGQGTEVLPDMKDFLEFCVAFKDPRLRVCVDTCHVFAAGNDPHLFLEQTFDRGSLLKLVHFNDSLGDKGSCVDRHAMIGTGKIGYDEMHYLAEICRKFGADMVIE